MLKALFWLLGCIPLRVNHALGGFLGRLLYRFDKTMRTRQDANLAQARETLPSVPTAQLVATETGKQALELAWIWAREWPQLAPLVKLDANSAEIIDKAVATIFLTPHLGAFEIAGQAIAARRTLVAMYSPPRVRALDAIMRKGRDKSHCVTVPADMTGIKAMLKALRHGDAIGILPDQAPSTGDGIWAPLFGKPAYTMTLIGKLAASTGARLVMCVAQREPAAQGFSVRAYEIPPPPTNPLAAATALNVAVQEAIAHHPAQYLWSYNRYKHPGGARALESSAQ